MGFPAQVVSGMSLWEFGAQADGYARANGAEDEVKAPSADEHDAALAKWGGH